MAVQCESGDPSEPNLNLNGHAADIDDQRSDFESIDMLSNEATLNVAGPSEDCGKQRWDIQGRFQEPLTPRIKGKTIFALLNVFTPILGYQSY